MLYIVVLSIGVLSFQNKYCFNQTIGNCYHIGLEKIMEISLDCNHLQLKKPVVITETTVSFMMSQQI